MRPDPDQVPAPGRLPRRGTDRVEDLVAWILSAAALLLIVVAGVVGLAVHGNELERAEQQRDTTYATRAVLLEPAPVEVGEGGWPVPTRALAAWTDRSGREHRGMVTVDGAQPAGAQVEVWVDDAGEITNRPPSAASAVVAGVAVAVGILCAGGTLLVATWLGARYLIGLVNDRRWEREWAAVEPQWRRNLL